MPDIKIKGYGSIELKERDKLRKIDITKPVKLGELYRDEALEIEE